MAFSTLTNPRIILSLGPNRSILGTLIRPDPVLMERKGGSNGEVTFHSLLPGAGEPLHHDILCNWHIDDEEEPLRRGKDILTPIKRSSSKKRKSAYSENSNKKLKENGDSWTRNENGSGKENSARKKKREKWW